MHLRQLVYCAVLIGIFGAFAKAVTTRLARFVAKLCAWPFRPCSPQYFELGRTGCTGPGPAGGASSGLAYSLRHPSTMNLVTFCKLTLLRMVAWPIRRTRFSGSLKAPTSFNSPLAPLGFHQRRHLLWPWDRSSSGILGLASG